MSAARDELEAMRGQVDRFLEGALPPAGREPKALHRAMRYAVFPGGKRIRPLIMLAVGDALRAPRKLLLPAACAVELIHSFSLVHDDLPAMDNDDFRRGLPTCHRVFGDAIAVLAGDALLTLAFKLLAEECPPRFVATVAEAVGSLGMAGGQALDILAQKGKRCAGGKRRIDDLKTGRLFRVCFEAPMFFAPVDAKTGRRLRRLGKEFGRAFQIRDDLVDGEGDAARLRRQLAALCRSMRAEAGLLPGRSAPVCALINTVAEGLSGMPPV